MIICEGKSVDMRASLILLSCLVGFALPRAPKCDVGTQPTCKDESLLQRKKGQSPCSEDHSKICDDSSEPSKGNYNKEETIGRNSGKYN